MQAFEDCHAKGFLWKATGMCNKLKTELNECLKKERAKSQKENRERAKPAKNRIREMWKDIDENS